MNKVSVIIPCYNKAPYVKEAIESVINQTFPDIEIIVVNDASTDNSAEIIKELKEKYDNILFINNKTNQGVVKTRNTAINIATGEYILPLDADDTIENTFVEKAVKILDKHPEIGVVGCRFEFDNKDTSSKGLIKNSKIMYLEELFVCTVMFRKTDFLKTGGYKECMDKLGCEDLELFLSFIENGLKFYKINEHLFNYRQNTENCRTHAQLKNTFLIKKQLITLHPNLYLKKSNIWMFFSSPKRIRKIKSRYKLFFVLWIVFASLVVIEAIAIIALLFIGKII